MTCHLYRVTGRIADCPRDACAFWEPGGAVVESGCAIERLGIPLEAERNPQLAHWLLAIRTRLEERREPEQSALMPLPPGLRD